MGWLDNSQEIQEGLFSCLNWVHPLCALGQSCSWNRFSLLFGWGLWGWRRGCTLFWRIFGCSCRIVPTLLWGNQREELSNARTLLFVQRDRRSTGEFHLIHRNNVVNSHFSKQFHVHCLAGFWRIEAQNFSPCLSWITHSKRLDPDLST